jgi:lysozyme
MEHLNEKTISMDGLKTLIASESSESHIYTDTAGFKTVGVGHKLLPDELSSGKIYISIDKVIDIRKPLTESEISDLLKHDLRRFEQAVNELVKTPISQGQFDALVHFSFNVGISAFKNSTLLKRVNEGRFDEVPDQIRRWNKITVTVNGQPEKRISKGLANRREVECDIWCEGTEGALSIDELLAEDKPQAPIEYDYPIATSREIHGYNKEVKPIWWSRIFSGNVVGLLGLGGAGTTLATAKAKVDTLLNDVINDPVGTSGDIANGFEQVTVNAAKVASTAADINTYLTYGAVIGCIILAGLVLSLYARLDDRAKRIN